MPSVGLLPLMTMTRWQCESYGSLVKSMSYGRSNATCRAVSSFAALAFCGRLCISAIVGSGIGCWCMLVLCLMTTEFGTCGCVMSLLAVMLMSIVSMCANISCAIILFRCIVSGMVLLFCSIT